ncbi:hypothetical protein [Glaciibacter sp. 2TAF33]|uniref:hypothetical protein n=1 Tax=Glaciibacter sp. 2TAF33 TaxID=3233015 RepID=UPI003F8FF0E5
MVNESRLQPYRQLLLDSGSPSADEVTTSAKRFPDGAHYRVEIPSTEGVEGLAAVFQAADDYGVPLHRVSQGSGSMLLVDDEIREMAAMCHSRNVELSLFVGPRAGWDISGQRTFGGNRLEGADQLVYSMDDLARAAELGVRGALVSDEGVLVAAALMRVQGLLPNDFVLKGSVQLMASNPLSVRMLEEAGLDTINMAPGMSLARLSAVRGAVDLPIDFYVEAPDNLGGFVRHYEIHSIIEALAPVYVKFGLRNHPDVYPSGGHLQPLTSALSRERVRRARIGLDLLDRLGNDFTMTQTDAPAEVTRLGVPQPRESAFQNEAFLQNG